MTETTQTSANSNAQPGHQALDLQRYYIFKRFPMLAAALSVSLLGVILTISHELFK